MIGNENSRVLGFHTPLDTLSHTVDDLRFAFCGSAGFMVSICKIQYISMLPRLLTSFSAWGSASHSRPMAGKLSTPAFPWYSVSMRSFKYKVYADLDTVTKRSSLSGG